MSPMPLYISNALAIRADVRTVVVGFDDQDDGGGHLHTTRENRAELVAWLEFWLANFGSRKSSLGLAAEDCDFREEERCWTLKSQLQGPVKDLVTTVPSSCACINCAFVQPRASTPYLLRRSQARKSFNADRVQDHFITKGLWQRSLWWLAPSFARMSPLDGSSSSAQRSDTI